MKAAYIFLMLLMLGSVFAADIDEQVIDALEQNDEISVIVLLKEDESTSVQGEIPPEYEFDVEREYSTITGFSATVTAQGVEQLENDPRVQSVFLDKMFHVSVDTSVPQINADDIWNFSINGYNITGKGETVCILDTGIDADHPAFQDKIKSQYCYCSSCCPGGGSENNSAEDDHGHGTHVAGIAAGNLTAYFGVAKDAGIYAIKVCDSAGSCTTSDIIAGIDRCSNTANISAFNISVISLSLGDGSQNNVFCNDDALAASINAAVGKNISVVIAAGNNGYTAGISSPACVQHATAVGAVNDNDAISYNRGAILELLAPGLSITSAAMDGGTTTFSGTSMSAPHVSGAIAIFRQYWKLAYGQTPTVDEIKRKFMVSGRQIDDSSNSGKSYSRIDILAALQPYMNFSSTSTSNNSIIGANTSFIDITSDVNLTNSLLEWTYNNGSIINMTLTKANGTYFYLNVTHLMPGIDTYRVYGNDTVGTIGISTVRTIRIDFSIPAVIISTPAQGSNFGSGTQAFNVTISDANINAVIFQFNNASGNDFNVSPANSSGNWNMDLDLQRLTQGSQTMVVYADDNAQNLNNTQFVEFTIDRTPPAVAFVSPADGQNYTLASGNQTLNATITDALGTVQSVLFSFDNASGIGFNVTAINQSGYWSASYNVSALANGSHTVTIFSNDTLGNLNSTQSITFTVDTTSITVTLLTPVSGNQNSSALVIFNCSAQHYMELRNITLYGNWSGGWHANETAGISGNRSSAVFSKTIADGNHLWNCLAYDTAGNSVFALANFTLTIDTIAPAASGISSGTPSSTSTTITWTTDENANSTVNYGTSLSLGTGSITTSKSASHSRTLSSLSASTVYFYNVTSCDALGNCLTNGTFNFTTAAASSDAGSSSSSGAGGGGGGGSSSSTSGSSSEEDSDNDIASAVDKSSTDGPGTAEKELTLESTTLPLITFSQSVVFTKGEPHKVDIAQDKISVKSIEINSRVDKETQFTISYLPEKPADVPELRDPYQYFEMKVDLSPQEIERAIATFEVPASWLAERNFLKETVSLNTFEDGKWKKLSTALVEEKEDVFVYQARLKHFSYFSITAHSELEFSWFKNLIPPAFGSRGFVIFGMVILIAFLLGLYWFIHRGEEVEDKV